MVRGIKGNLREQLVRQVRAEIIAGEIPPGTMYSVPTLSAIFGVSTTPAREALLELARVGLLEPMRNRGFRVKAPDLQQLKDLFDLREILELHAARIVARKTEKNLSILRPLAEAIQHSVEKEDIRGYVEADRNYHQAFLEAAGNTLLAETVLNLRDTMRLYGIRSYAGYQRQLDSIAEHYQIIELAEKGDCQQLEALMRHHIRSWEPIFIEALRPKTVLLAKGGISAINIV